MPVFKGGKAMATTRQHAYRLSPEHEKIIDKHARNLERVTGFSVSRADALRAILESFGRVERIREQRISSYRQLLEKVKEPGPERDRAQQALDDWLTMSHERMVNLAAMQAAGMWATGELRQEAARKGLDKLSDEEIQAGIAAARGARGRS
jgi:hypothetical protein